VRRQHASHESGPLKELGRPLKLGGRSAGEGGHPGSESKKPRSSLFRGCFQPKEKLQPEAKEGGNALIRERNSKIAVQDPEG